MKPKTPRQFQLSLVASCAICSSNICTNGQILIGRRNQRDSICFHIFKDFQWFVVATLALGSRPKQGLVKVRAKNEFGNHIACSQKCKRVGGNEPPHF
jgi:hypothetical protein